MSGPISFLPWVVVQALDDTSLPAMSRLTMWHLRMRLDGVHFVEVKIASLAAELRMKERNTETTLARLVDAGYLEVHHKQRPKAYRFPWARLQRDDVRLAA